MQLLSPVRLSGIMSLAVHGDGALIKATGAEPMKIFRAGSRPSQPGPAEWFTGAVRFDPIYNAEEPGRAAATLVTFEPAARTAWHTHPAGQALMVTAGVGRVQCEGEPIKEIHPGDVVWFPAGVKHWHGAAPDVAMSHIAIHEVIDGSSVTWMEHVTDEQYNG